MCHILLGRKGGNTASLGDKIDENQDELLENYRKTMEEDRNFSLHYLISKCKDVSNLYIQKITEYYASYNQ